MAGSDSLVVLTWILSIACWGTIFRKAGYSFWCGLTGILPVIPLLWLTFATWPTQRETASVRTRAKEGTQEDAYTLLDHALKLERRLDWDAAARGYENVIAQYAGTPAAQDAAVSLKALRERMAAR